MIKRNFIQPTNEEIREREKMYEEAASLGMKQLLHTFFLFL